MRNIETWKAQVLPKMIEDFPKRMQKDLESIKLKSIPELKSYYIQGPIGTGKTVLAAFLCLEAKKQRYLNPEKYPGEIIFTTVPEFLNNIKSSYDNPDLNEQSLLNRFSEAGFLVLDDFGAERTTDWAMSMLYLLINRRYEEMRITIFTSNLTLQELAGKLGDERIPARIERMCEVIEQTKF